MSTSLNRTIVKAHTAADFLAFVPHLVGYTPRQSVIFVMFNGKRTCGALRMDLPPSGPPALLKHFTTVALATIAEVPDVQTIVPVVFTEEEFGDDSLIPHAALMDVVRRRCRHVGLPLREALCLAADGWASYLDRVTPRGGRPLAEVSESDVIAVLPEDERASAGDHLSEASYVPPDEDASRQTTLAMAGLRAKADIRRTMGASMPELSVLDDVPAFIETALAWSDRELLEHGALLLFALQGPPMRDQTMVQWAAGYATGKHLHAEVENAHGDPLAIDPALGDIMIGMGPRPDPERMLRGIEILRTLLRSAEGKYRLPVLCMLAWLSWGLGRVSHAAIYVKEARAIDPDYSMAELLDTIVASGRLPEWAFAREQSSQRPVSRLGEGWK